MNNESMLVPIDGDRIRKVWHNDEWYYSVIDIISFLLELERKHASRYWRVLKTRLKSEGNESASNCKRLKLPASDGKMRMTDVVNENSRQDIVTLIQRKTFNSRRRIERQEDEVINIQPLVAEKFRSDGWHITQSLQLPSGKFIDLIAIKNDETIIIECKPKLRGGYLFRAIGQVLCYVAEYGNAKPVLACLNGKVSKYAYKRCQDLGIDIVEISIKATTQ